MSNIAYHLDLERLVNINEPFIESGLNNKKLVLPSDTDIYLVAKKGNINEHHFAIYNPDGTYDYLNNYVWHGESEIHKKYKKKILDEKKIKVYDDEFTFVNVVLEKGTNVNTKEKIGFIPDIQAVDKNGDLYFIEIVYKHDVDDIKLEKIKEYGVPVIRYKVTHDDKEYISWLYDRDNNLNLEYDKLNQIKLNINSQIKELINKKNEIINKAKQEIQQNKKSFVNSFFEKNKNNRFLMFNEKDKLFYDVKISNIANDLEPSYDLLLHYDLIELLEKMKQSTL